MSPTSTSIAGPPEKKAKDWYTEMIICTKNLPSETTFYYPSDHGMRLSPEYPQIGFLVSFNRNCTVSFEIAEPSNSETIWHYHNPTHIEGFVENRAEIGDRYLFINCPLQLIRIILNVFDVNNECRIYATRASDPALLRRLIRVQIDEGCHGQH